METNVDTQVTDRAPPTDTSAPRERLSVRDSLRQSFADARQEEETTERQARTDEPEVEVEEPVEETTETPEVEPAEGEAEETTTTEAEPKPKAGPPVAWTKNAKDAWPHLPEAVKQAAIKREADVEKGIKAIKDKYSELDQVLAPYDGMIKQFNKTRGQAVGQMFSWFDALSKNPDQSFPALMQSYGYDPKRLLQAYGISPQVLQRAQQLQQQQNGQAQQQNGQVQNGQVQNGQAQQQPQGAVPPALQQYINKLEQRLNGFEQQVGQQFTGLQNHFAEQSAAKTQEMLNQWSSDKKYFDRVRTKMGYLLTPDATTGVAVIPLRDGRVDLDSAYEQALWMDPEIRQEMLAEQQAAEAAARKAKQAAAVQAQQDKTAQARRTASSVTTSAPGGEVSRKTTPNRGSTVRESLKAAIAEISDR
jgi:hypothetical protein